MQLFCCAPRILLGCFFFLASCGEDKAAPNSGPAGQVKDVEGEVSATRAGQPARPLRLEDTVYGDDTVRTGATGSADILLHHNGALWQLGANKERRVDESAAWRAERQELGAFDKDEEVKTSAAGRNTTREAAESKETLLESKSKSESESESKSKSKSKSKSNRESKSESKSNKADRADVPVDVPPAPPEPERSRRKSKRKTKKSIRRKSNKTGKLRPAPKRELSILSESTEDTQPDPPPPPPPPPASRPPSAKQTQAAFVRKHARACQRKHGGQGSIRYSLQAKGRKVDTLKVSGSDSLAAVVTCLDSRLRAATLPNDEAISGQTRLGSQ